jgi:hypothetical protein
LAHIFLQLTNLQGLIYGLYATEAPIKAAKGVNKEKVQEFVTKWTTTMEKDAMKRAGALAPPAAAPLPSSAGPPYTTPYLGFTFYFL